MQAIFVFQSSILRAFIKIGSATISYNNIVCIYYIVYFSVSNIFVGINYLIIIIDS